MIDIHLHILPGVDDGPQSFATAVEMCRAALDDGCEVLLATPHVRHHRWLRRTPEELRSLLERLQQRVGPRPRLLLGSEIRTDSDLLAEIEVIRRTSVLPLADSKYLLLEFSRYGVGPEPEQLLHEILLFGWVPVVAHPEFIPQVGSDPGLAQRLAAMGALLQVTAMSLTGEFGREIRAITRSLVDRGLVHFVASDAHDLSARPTGLRRAYAEIARQWGVSAAETLTTLNPQAILENRSVESEVLKTG